MSGVSAIEASAKLSFLDDDESDHGALRQGDDPKFSRLPLPPRALVAPATHFCTLLLRLPLPPPEPPTRSEGQTALVPSFSSLAPSPLCPALPGLDDRRGAARSHHTTLSQRSKK